MRPLSLTLVLALTAPIGAQCFHLGGNTPTTGTCNVIPFGTNKTNTTWRNQRYQTYLTAAELGGKAGMVCGLGFSPCGNGSGEWNFATIEVRMGHKTTVPLTTNFAGNFNGTPVTVLKLKNYTWRVQGGTWNDIGLQKPFAFNGKDNLVIEITVTAAGRISGRGTGFHRQGSRQRVYAFGWSGTPPTIARGTDSAAQKMRACIGVAGTGTYGAGCPTNQPLTLSYSGSSKLGSTLMVDLSNRPGAKVGFVLIGNTNAAPFPISLAGSNMPGCFLYTNALLTRAMPFINGKATVKIAVPNNPSLLCAILYNQGAALDPGANGLGVSVSNYGRVVTGN